MYSGTFWKLLSIYWIFKITWKCPSVFCVMTLLSSNKCTRSVFLISKLPAFPKYLPNWKLWQIKHLIALILVYLKCFMQKHYFRTSIFWALSNEHEHGAGKRELKAGSRVAGSILILLFWALKVVYHFKTISSIWSVNTD